MVTPEALDAGANWHPSGWSRVFIGGDTLSAADSNFVGFTTLQHPARALTVGYKPTPWNGRDDGAFIVTGQIVRGVKDGLFVWVVIEGDPAVLPNFTRA